MQTQACQLNAAIVVSEWRAGVKLLAGEDPSSNGTAVVAVYQVRGITNDHLAAVVGSIRKAVARRPRLAASAPRPRSVVIAIRIPGSGPADRVSGHASHRVKTP